MKKMKKSGYLVVILFLIIFLLFLLQIVSPASLNVYPSKDNYLDSGIDDDENRGASTNIIFDDSDLHGLIDFDFSSIPKNSSVTDADFYLYFSTASSGDTKYAYPITKSWNEGTGNGDVNDATINGSTWLERWYGDNANDGCSGDSDPDWCTEGLGTSDYNTTHVSSFTGGTGWQSFDVTTIINMSVNNLWTFYGWILINQDGSNHVVRSKEYTGTTYDPYLSITYSYPKPTFSNLNPMNDTTQTFQSVTFNCTSSFESVNSLTNITDLALYYANVSGYSVGDIIDSHTLVFNETSDPIQNHTESINWSTSITTDGVYYWWCGTDATFSNGVNTGEFQSEERTLTIDSTAPNITFESPTPADSSRQISNSVTINVSLSDLSTIDTCLLEWNNTASITNYTMTKSGDYCNYTIATTDGTQYWYKVYANDTQGLLGNSSIRTFTENTIPTIPNVNLIPASPYANDTLTCTGSGSTDSESDGLTYFYQFNDTDGSILQDYVNSPSCYQESSNVSTSCGGLNTGTYTTSDNWQNLANIYDGDWNTYGGVVGGIGTFTATLYINYTKPFGTGSPNTLWRVKTLTLEQNLTIPSDCWDYNNDTLSLKFYSYYKNSPEDTKAILSCQNSTGWRELYSESYTDSNSRFLYEEAITWSIINNTFNCSDYASCTKSDNITCNVKSYDGYEYSSINYSTVTIQNFVPIIASWNISNETWSVNSGVDITIYENSTNGTYTFNITSVTDIDSGDSLIYKFVIGGNTKQTGSQSWYDWVLGSDSVGEYNVTVYVNDTSNGLDTQYWNITIVDNTNPIITLTDPTDGGFYLSGTNMDLKFTYSDVHPDDCWYTTNGGSSNTTIVDCANTTFTVSDGSYNITIYINDTSNNIGSDTHPFEVDSSAPSVTNLQEPTDPITYVWNAIYLFNATVTDTNLQTVLLDFNGTNYTATNLVGDIYNVTLLYLNVGTYDYTWYANDTSGNVNNSEDGSYTINKATPSFSTSVSSPIIYGTASNYVGSSTNNGDTGCTYILKRAGVQIDTGNSVSDNSVLGTDTYEYNYSTSGCGNYNAGSDIKSLTVDKDVPEGSLTSNEGWTIESGIEVTIGLSESNSGDGDVTYKVYRDNVDKGTGETWTPSIGTYDYVLNSTEGANWTANTSMDSETLTVQDTLFPLIEYDSQTPVNYANLSQNWLYVNVTWTEVNLANITFTLKNDTGTINSTVFESATYEINWTGLADGNYFYYVNITDTSNNQNSTSIRYVNLDATNPLIDWGIGVEVHESNVSQLNIFFNVTYTETNCKRIIYYNREPEESWDDVIYNNCQTYHNTTGLVDGFYEYYVYIEDDAGNSNTTPKRNITLDATNPTVSIVFPSSDNNWYDHQIEINYTFTEENPDTCKWTKDGGATNTTLASCGTNITGQSWSQGETTVTIYINDTSGNEGSATRIFNIDTINPSVNSLQEPIDPAIYSYGNNYQFNATITDTNLDTVIFEFGGVNYTPSNIVGDVYNYTFADLGVGAYNYRWYANDSVGNMNSTSSGSYTINKANLLGDLTSNLGWTINESQEVTIGLSESNSGDGDVTYKVYRDNVDKGTGETWTPSLGTYSYILNSTGGANYSLNSSIDDQTLTVNDVLIPYVNFIYPQNTSYNVNVSQINYSYTETHPEKCWYSLNGGATNSSTQTCGTNWTGLVSTEGSNTWIVYMNDTSGNENSTSVTFFKDTTYPLIDYEPETPTDNSNLSQSYLYVNVSITETNFQNVTFTLKNDTGSVNSTTYNVITYEINWTGLAENNYTYYVNVSDTLGNMNSTSVRKITLDITNPDVNLTSPKNNTYTSNVSLNFTANISDNSGIKNATLYIYNSSGDLVNETTTTFNAGVVDTVVGTVVTLVEEVYTWFYKAWDWAGNFFNPVANYTVTIDTTNPSISYNANSDADGYWKQVGNIFINVTASDTNKDVIMWEFDGTNETFASSSGDVYWENKTGLSTGTYNFYAWLNDSAGNFNKTSTRTVNIDVDNPVVTIDHPRSQNYNTNISLPLNYTVTDANLHSCWWNIDGGSNITLPSCLNTTFNTSEATHTIYVYANDSSGRETFDNVTFTVNLAPPSISLDHPNDNQWLNYRQNIDFNYTPTDTDGISVCQFWGNWSGGWHLNDTETSPVSGSTNTFNANLTNGSFMWNVWCNDTGDNSAWGNVVGNNTVNIDPTFPLISYGDGIEGNNTNTTNTFIFVNVSVTEINEDTITFLLHNSTGEYNKTSYVDGTRSINWTSLIDDTYTYNVTVNDSAGNTNSTIMYTIRLDDTSPEIDILLPESINYAYNTSLPLNYTVADNLVGVDVCWYKIENMSGGYIDSIVIDNTTLTNCQNTTFSVPSGDIDYTVTVYANDTNGNEDSYSVVFGVRTIAPSIVLGIADEYFFNINTNVVLNTTTTDIDGINVCELYGNWTGAWHKNQTNNSVITSGVLFNWSALNLSENIYLWNVWCNDTYGNSDWASSNRTFGVDITYPIPTIVSITPVAGSQTFTFSSTATDLHTLTCKYSIFDSLGAINGLNENVSFTCNDASTSATVTAYGTYNLTIYAQDKAGNENSSTDSFTTATSPTTPSVGGGTTIIIEGVTVLGATNFSVTTLNFLDRMDIALAKDSVKERKKQFYITNQGLDYIEVEIICDTQTSNESTRDISICDYVEFEQTNFTVSPNEEERSLGTFTILTPPNSSLGDVYYFSILGVKKMDEETRVSKLSVSARVSFLASLYKWEFLPFQDKPDEEKTKFPILAIALTFSFIIFSLLFFTFRKFDLDLTGFFSGIVGGIFVFILIIFVI